MKKKTSEVQLTPIQQRVIDFIKANSDANPDAIIEGTRLPKITAYATLKALVNARAIEVKEVEGKKTYSMVDEVKQERPVVETTNNNHVEEKKEEKKKPADGKRDFSKYKFNGEIYSKGGLVREIVAQFCKDKKPSITKLREVFPDNLIPTYGVFQELSVAKKRSGDKQRYFLKPDQVIKLKDKTVAVTNQLTSAYLEAFLVAAKKLGYTAKIV
jgi:Fe2+ or Zn2+ uptake regulation protein